LAASAREPAAAALADLAVTFQRRQHAVEVVLLDAHRRGDLTCRDAGPSLHKLERLQRACATAPRTPTTPRACARCRCTTTTPATSCWARCARKPRKGCLRCLELTVLVNQRLELPQPCGNLLPLGVQKITHLINNLSLYRPSWARRVGWRVPILISDISERCVRLPPARAGRGCDALSLARRRPPGDPPVGRRGSAGAVRATSDISWHLQRKLTFIT
jgi:hypothetical protein